MSTATLAPPEAPGVTCDRCGPGCRALHAVLVDPERNFWLYLCGHHFDCHGPLIRERGYYVAHDKIIKGE